MKKYIIMKNMKEVFCFLSIFISINTSAQKKVLDHPDFDIWNRIQNSTIGSKGNLKNETSEYSLHHV